MKGIGAAGGGGQPWPLQPPSRPRPRRFLGAPRAVQTPTAPSPGTMRAPVRSSGPRGSPVLRGSALPEDGVGLSLREAADASFVGEVGSVVGCSFPEWPRGSAEVPGERLGCTGRALLLRPRLYLCVLLACLPLQEVHRAGIGPSRGIVKEPFASLVKRGHPSLVAGLLPFKSGFQQVGKVKTLLS